MLQLAELISVAPTTHSRILLPHVYACPCKQPKSQDADLFLLNQLEEDLLDLEERLFQGALLGSEWDVQRPAFHEKVQCERSTKVS